MEKQGDLWGHGDEAQNTAVTGYQLQAEKYLKPLPSVLTTARKCLTKGSLGRLGIGLGVENPSWWASSWGAGT